MQKLEESLKYKIWRQSLADQGITVHGVSELETIRKPGGEVIFALIEMNATDPDGHPLLPTVLLRGHFVSVMTLLVDRETDEEFLLMVRQRRVGNGGVFYEHPAGMCDSETDPYEVALKEIHEETGLVVAREDLHRLNKDLLYSSPGLIDEAGYFFFCRIELSRNEIGAFNERDTGDGGEHERIRTFVCPIGEALPLMRNTNSLINWYLYHDFLKRPNTGESHDPRADV